MAPPGPRRPRPEVLLPLPIRADDVPVLGVAQPRPGIRGDPLTNETHAPVGEADVDAPWVPGLSAGDVTRAEPIGTDLELRTGKVARKVRVAELRPELPVRVGPQVGEHVGAVDVASRVGPAGAIAL